MIWVRFPTAAMPFQNGIKDNPVNYSVSNRGFSVGEKAAGIFSFSFTPRVRFLL
jgi:hypothetical protein